MDDAGDSGDAETPDGGSWPSTVSYKSGTRLRAVVWDSQAGMKVFRYWRDTQLDTDCEIERATDDVRRCLPRSWAGNHYSDPACTQRVAYQSECVVPIGKYARVNVSNDWCLTDYIGMDEVRATGPQTTGPLYTLLGTQCQLKSASATYHPLTTLVAPSAFAAAQFVDVPQGGDLALRVAQFPDGAEQRVGLTRVSTGVACGYEKFADGSEACIDVREAYPADYFTNSQCTGETLAVGPSPTCPAPKVMTKVSSDPCAWTLSSVYALGAAVPSTQVYNGTGSSCYLDSESEHSFFMVGSELSPSSFPQLTRIRLGTGRIQVDYVATASKQPLVPVRLWDSLANHHCFPHPAPDGVVRCILLTDASPSFGTYSDATCNTSIALWMTNCPLQSPVTGILQPSSAYCSYRYLPDPHAKLLELRKLEAYSGSWYWKPPFETCQLDSFSGVGVFTQGAVIAPTDFAPLFTVVE